MENCNSDVDSIIGKKIVIFNGTLMQGGAERVISILSKKMAEMGIDVQILLYHDKQVFYEIDSKVKITVVERESESKNVARNILWLRKFFSENADVVISFLAPFNIVALIAHAGLKSKIIVADRNDPRYVPSNFFIRKIRDFLYNFADGIVLQTQHNKDYFGKRIRDNSVIIFNPVDLGKTAGLARRVPKQKKIVSVGRLMPQKNQVMLLNAFARVHVDHPDYSLVIYGEGTYRSTLELKIDELGLSQCISLPGSSTTIFNDIADAQVFVLSSNYEGMPNALMEAMCLGLPCISTRVSGATDLIEDGYNGCLIEIGDEDRLYNKINMLIEDKTVRDGYAKRAVELNTELNVDKIIGQWIAYISNIM